MTTATVQAFYKGTGILFPFQGTDEKAFATIDKVVSKYTETVERIVAQMDYWEEYTNANSKCGFLSEKKQIQIAKDLGYDEYAVYAITWCANVRFLLNKGAIKEDDNFGFLVIRCKNAYQDLKKAMEMVHKNEKKCYACGIKGKHYCANCNQAMYCSKECQRSHWKEHKKTCSKK